MSDWQPTMHLRFVERAGKQVGENLFILQQWWVRRYRDGFVPQDETEWRDVPIERQP